MDVRMFVYMGAYMFMHVHLILCSSAKRSGNKCANISTGAQVPDVFMGNSTGHQTGFIVGINCVRTRQEIGNQFL